MIAQRLIEDARAAGFSIEVDGGDLIVEADRNPPAELLIELREHKAELIAFLIPPVPVAALPYPEPVDDLGERAGIIECGANVPRRWAEVADALHDRFGMQVVLVGGRTSRELNAERIVMERARHKPRSELGSGLRKLVSILDASALVLSPDTGPLHMAVALDRPVISLMGYTNPKRTGPYRKFKDLIIDAYGDPGENYPISMENRPGRMARIETQDVLDKVALWQRRYAGVTA